MNLITVQLGDLIDDALNEVRSPSEVGRTVVISEALSSSDTTFHLTTGSADPTQLLEIGGSGELMLVTTKSDESDPEYTVLRGYYGTTAESWPASTAGVRDPQFPRTTARYAVIKAFNRLESAGIPLITSQFLTVEDSPFEDDPWPVLDPGEDVRDVLEVRSFNQGEPDWEFIDNVPTSEWSSGNLIRLRSCVRTEDEDQFTVVSRVPFRWSSHPNQPTDDDTIEVPEGAERLPATYAAAFLCRGREISRYNLDRVEEWAASEPSRDGVSARFVRELWADFYRELDEVRRLNPVPKRRPFRRRQRTRLRQRWGVRL